MNIDPRNIFIKEYDYNLPSGRIAMHPLAIRDESKLLIYKDGIITDDRFSNISQYLPEYASLILNNTRVIEARILFKKPSGGSIEIFCLEPFEQSMETSLLQTGMVKWQCLIGGASKWKPGQLLEKKVLAHEKWVVVKAKYLARLSDSFLIEFSWEEGPYSFGEILHATGAVPLPPYIKREVTEEDKERYQTIFGKHEGSVAAPTAALHFSASVFEKFSKKNIAVDYITLHVGAGTFKPVKTATIAEHRMHQEPFTVTKAVLQKIISSQKLIAVGTTTLRTIESLYWLGVKLLNGLIVDNWMLGQWEAYELANKFPEVGPMQSLQAIVDWLEEKSFASVYCQTSLMIVPGYSFKIPAGLITNFHQPQSTLLLLVSAFIGDDWKKVYAHALDNNYRFLSYGDSSLLWRPSR